MARTVLILKTLADKAKALSLITEAPFGARLEVKTSKRTNDQNAKLWAMLGDVSEQVVWYGQKLCQDDWKDVFTASLRGARVVPGIDQGTFVPLGMRTSDMEIDEFGDLIELIYAFGAERNVVWSDPTQEQAA